MKTEMTLKKLTISRRESYEDNAGKLVARIEYEGSAGNINMPLDDGITEKLTQFIAPLLAEFGSKAASEIAASVTNALPSNKPIELGERYADGATI